MSIRRMVSKTVFWFNTIQIRTHHVYRIGMLLTGILFMAWTLYYSQHGPNQILQKPHPQPNKVNGVKPPNKAEVESHMTNLSDIIISLDDLPQGFVQDPATFTKTSSLTFTPNGQFQLQGRPLTIIAGSMHYFRMAEGHWLDRMTMMRAAGINTLDTCIVWNLHEEIRGTFDFDGMLDLRKYLSIAQTLGLYVVIRPGPFVGADWEFGGLPSWLLSDPKMKVRTGYHGYLHAVKSYFKRLGEEISDLQFSKGGPIIAIQIEHEYGHFSEDNQYLIWLRNTLMENGFTELFYTTDKHSGFTQGTIPGVLATASFSDINEGGVIFQALNARQKGAPLWVTGYPTGSADHWGKPRVKRKDKDFEDVLTYIFLSKSSVTFTMFQGGTNFGFMNGANGTHTYATGTTSYDFGAPISEGGELTKKYSILKSVIEKYHPQYVANNISLPATPTATSYGEIVLNGSMSLENLLSFVVPTHSNSILPMEFLTVNNGGGQNHGFTLYRKNGFVTGRELTINGRVGGIAQIMINGEAVETLAWYTENLSVSLPSSETGVRVDILVENTGRISSVTTDYKEGFFDQRKGIVGTITVDGEQLMDWSYFSLEFKEQFIKSVVNAQSKWDTIFEFSDNALNAPIMLMGELNIQGKPRDTYLDMSNWSKGVVFINGRNLGRYWNSGPQTNLYVPSPWLKEGYNYIIVLELNSVTATSVKSTDKPDLGRQNRKL